MRIDADERVRRVYLETLWRVYKKIGKVIEVEAEQEIIDESLKRFTRELKGKVKNLQPGEYLSVKWDIDIIRSNGKVRGGSGAQRNMPEYIEWRMAVYQRDNYTCQECGSKAKIQAHHIKAWSSHPALRFDIGNGVTLCHECHAAKHPHLKFS